MARLEMRRRCTWRIFQSIEYAGEQDHLRLNRFFDYLMTYFTPSSSKERDFLNRILSEPEMTKDPKLEKSSTYESVVVPDSYMGPRLSFPLLPDHATVLLEAFKQEQHLHAHYVLRLLHETQKYLTQLPNITSISTCCSKEITVCGDLHGQLNDLFLIFYKNGLPSPQKPYVFNGDFVDRGKWSIEVLIILFAFLLIYPKEVHLNRGNHEDYMINLRYGFTKEVIRKYKILSPLTQKRKNSKVELYGSKFGRSSLLRGSDSSNKTALSQQLQDSIQAEQEMCRRLAGNNPSLVSSATTAEVGVRSCESVHFEEDDIQQVIDILWSDPIPQNGCQMNQERGGGCYFGPDVTKEILQKHGLQFIIRSHECKPDGYEVCHDRKVITVFSASNYYTEGSNRGAYLKLGPDLNPHIIQYQANKAARKLTMTQRISLVEESAYLVLKEKVFAHRSQLIAAFKGFDKTNTGMITLDDWAKALESVLQLGLPWRMLRAQLVSHLISRKLDYKLWLKQIVTEQWSSTEERLQSSLLENIYRNLSNLETVFSIIDSDHSGLISHEEFHHTFRLFSSHMNIDISDENIEDLACSIDFNKDGNIDFNEFLEAFRLVRKPSL
ncbi:serine/threonine-protein phosphatase with EF-hands 2 isoform X2 [Rhineura floridana]|uniref:serine/threonine-protein phosphatase with EF-hands 2 isoform X2 n=1 Tax=Rhineura floridana TaxID=261503 RepID=UPI002AC83C23|nr:serine/threonine-protein phosphatase with EF-hands 2 isoform X2 [Rhineura floridana]